MNEKITARERLANKMKPAYLGFGKAVSTDAGKALFALLYDADCALDTNARVDNETTGRRATRAHEDARYFHGLSRGERAAYARALAMMASEASEGEVSAHMCLRVVNIEIDAMRNRTMKERQSAPVTNISSLALDVF